MPQIDHDKLKPSSETLNEQFQAEALETKPQDDDKKLSLGAQASSCKLSISRSSLVAEAFT